MYFVTNYWFTLKLQHSNSEQRLVNCALNVRSLVSSLKACYKQTAVDCHSSMPCVISVQKICEIASEIYVQEYYLKMQLYKNEKPNIIEYYIFIKDEIIFCYKDMNIIIESSVNLMDCSRYWQG